MHKTRIGLQTWIKNPSKKEPEKLLLPQSDVGRVSDQLTAVGTVALIGAAPLLYVVDKKMSVRRKLKLRRN